MDRNAYQSELDQVQFTEAGRSALTDALMAEQAGPPVQHRSLWMKRGMAAVLAAVLFFYRELFYIGFDENAARISGVSVRNINFLFTILTALTVSIASRTVGTLIVSSMLVVPVACGMQMAKSYKGTLICAIIVAVCTTIAGLFLSYYAELKPGGMIVLLEVAWFVVVMTVKSFNK